MTSKVTNLYFSPLQNFALLSHASPRSQEGKIRSTKFLLMSYNEQKHSSRGVPRRICSENMQQVYRRTLISKCDFNKVELFGIGVPLKLYFIFSGYPIIRTPLEGCFCIRYEKLLRSSMNGLFITFKRNYIWE